MKWSSWFVLLLFAFGLILISGCTQVETGCVDDGHCSLNEKYIGTCADCAPDFYLSNDFGSYSFYDDGMLFLESCVVARDGEYTGNLPFYLEVTGDNGKVLFHMDFEEYVDFDSDEFWSYANLDVFKGGFKYNSQAALDDDSNTPKIYCFNIKGYLGSRSYPYYNVKLVVNPDKSVSEKNYDNNELDFRVNGNVEHYPDILIERDIGEFKYIYSNNKKKREKGYSFDLYIAYYNYTRYAYDNYPGLVRAEVAIFDSKESAEEFLNIIISDENENVKKIEKDGLLYYELSQGLFWKHGNKLIAVSYPSGEEGEALFREYVSKYPSDIIKANVGSSTTTTSTTTTTAASTTTTIITTSTTTSTTITTTSTTTSSTTSSTTTTTTTTLKDLPSDVYFVYKTDDDELLIGDDLTALLKENGYKEIKSSYIYSYDKFPSDEKVENEESFIVIRKGIGIFVNWGINDDNFVQIINKFGSNDLEDYKELDGDELLSSELDDIYDENFD